MDWWITFDQQAADYLPDLRIEKEEPMDRHTSFRIGGPARRMAFPERGEQLVLLLDMAARCGARPLVMGNGTNLLAPDEGLDRLVIDTSAGLSRVEAGGTPGTILAEAGLSFLGLGISAPTASWGSMVSEGRLFLLQNPVFALTPGVCVAVLVICLNMFGDGVRDALDPRLRGEV